MEYAELLLILNDLNAELIKDSPTLSTIVLVADHETGESKYYSSGFPEVQASMIKAMLEKDKVLVAFYFADLMSTTKPS